MFDDPLLCAWGFLLVRWYATRAVTALFLALVICLLWAAVPGLPVDMWVCQVHLGIVFQLTIDLQMGRQGGIVCWVEAEMLSANVNVLQPMMVGYWTTRLIEDPQVLELIHRGVI